MVRRCLLCLLCLALGLVAAGCGGSSRSTGTTGGVAGAQTTQQFLSPTFEGSVNAIARQISAQVAALQKNLDANAQIGSALQKANCTGTVNTQLTQRADTAQEKRAAKQLAGACGALTRALHAANQGDTSQAKQLAVRALSQAKSAAR
jgi:hypothetical protein